MAVTAYIKPITTNKGIFYTFQSAVDDITNTFNHDNKKFKFSKFALLRIPEMGVPETLETDNKMQFLAVGETPLIDGINSSNYNINLAESFQNYCLNLEALILSGTDYDRTLRNTVAERVFWKWMKETGSIRFRRANTINEKDSDVITDERYVEEDSIDSTYEKVVKYIADIDAVNSVRGENSYTEVYIYVPTNVGTTPRIMFDSYQDDNYKPGMRIQNFPDDPLNIEYLSGRKFDDTHPHSLSIKAFYDLDNSSVTTEISDDIDSPSYTEDNWFNDTTVNSYYTDSSFDTYDNQLIKKTLDSSEVNYIRNTLDGIEIDFTLENYKLANDLDGVNTFSQFAEVAGNDSKNFEFNAILVYYDVYDIPADPDEETVITTNLYGIYFLNKVNDLGSGDDFFIPTVPKYKPDIINKTNGNAITHKINIKFDTSINEAAVDKSINDFNTFSMDLYMDALSQMVQLNETYTENLAFIQDTRNEIDELKDLFVNDTNKNEILKRIASIESSLLENQSLFDNTDTVMGLIKDLYKKYNDIINDKTTVPINVAIDQTTLNNLIIRNQEYNLTSTPVGNILDTTTLTLVKYTNYFKHYKSTEITLGKDLVINIDDTDVKWTNGQVFRLIFDSQIDLGVYNVRVKTDAPGRVTGSEYGKEVVVFDSLDFESSSKKPIFEIMCTNATTLEFEITKIR